MKAPILILNALVVGLFATPLYADDAPREAKSEFRQHIVRRDRLIRELHSLDERAASAVADGKTPNETHAQQIELQDQIDLLQLRIETMALRWNLEIPDPPEVGPGSPDLAAEATARVESAFGEGRIRADRALQARCRRMLAGIDYDAILARGK